MVVGWSTRGSSREWLTDLRVLRLRARLLATASFSQRGGRLPGGGRSTKTRPASHRAISVGRVGGRRFLVWPCVGSWVWCFTRRRWSVACYACFGVVAERGRFQMIYVCCSECCAIVVVQCTKRAQCKKTLMRCIGEGVSQTRVQCECVTGRACLFGFGILAWDQISVLQKW